MEKIVILTGNSENDSKLIECLKTLFPECEIDVQKRESDDNKPADIIFKHDDDYELSEDLEKYLSFL